MIIYKATNKINGKCYIGQTIKSLNNRIKDHFQFRKKLSCPYFHRSLQKHGINNFEWSVLEECESHQELDEMEFHYIKQFNAYVENGGYNLTFGGGGCSGYKLTDEQKNKIISANAGIKKSKDHRKKISSIKKSQWSDKESIYNSKDFRDKLSASHKGERNGMYGSVHSDVSKRTISQRAKERFSDKNNHPMYGKKGKDNPNFDRKNSKKIWLITLKNGDEVECYNLDKFCREYEDKYGIKLHSGNLVSVSKGNLDHYKGLKCKSIERF